MRSDTEVTVRGTPRGRGRQGIKRPGVGRTFRRHVHWFISLQREREMFYLTTHSTHFIYAYMASDIWLRTILIVRKETRCRHIDYSYQLTARVLIYMHHSTDRITHTTAFVTPVVEYWLEREIAQWRNSPMKDRSDDPSHHEQTLYI